ELQHALGVGAERYVDRRRDLFAEHRAAFDFLADAVERQVRPGKNPAGQALAFANQAEQQMLGLDRRAAHLRRFIPRKEENASGPFGIAFKHRDPCRHYTASVSAPSAIRGWPAGRSRPPSRRSTRSHADASAELCVAMIEVKPCSRCISFSNACNSSAVCS